MLWRELSNMKKKLFVNWICSFSIIMVFVTAITFSALLYGVTSSDNTISSMAYAFDKYLKTTGQDFVAAEFSCDEVNDPIRQGDFYQASLYQNLWQLSKGPDNSLIRVNRPVFFDSVGSVVSPLTLYPKNDKDDDSDAIEPIVYTGYDQDFRGDYLDIKILQLSDEEKQINWSDFYKGGKLEKYKQDTHSILVSETVAKQIYSSKFNITIENIDLEDIESLVGTTIRCKTIQESGFSEAIEREENKPIEERDESIVNSPYYSNERSRVKKIIGILDNKSAEKYYPIIGESFVFVVPNMYVSYDYFHPTVYGMFKNNLVGNRTSLRYFMCFSDYAIKHDNYHLYFCDIASKSIDREGMLQKNYEKCLTFYGSSKQDNISTSSLVANVLLSVILISYFLFLIFRRQGVLRKKNMSYLIMLLLSFSISLFILSFVDFSFILGFHVSSLSVGGFTVLLLTELLIISFVLIVGVNKKQHIKKDVLGQTFNGEKNSLSKKQKVLNHFKQLVFPVAIGFFAFVVIHSVTEKNSINSLKIAC